jgi:hypothetical protein
MVEDNLTIPLFLIGTSVALVTAGIHQAGWRHRLLIYGLFASAGILFFIDIFWHWLKSYSPTVATTAISDIAANSVAWFVVIMFGLAVVLFRRPRPPSAEQNDRRISGRVLVPQDIHLEMDDNPLTTYKRKLQIILRNGSEKILQFRPLHCCPVKTRINSIG